MYRKTQFFSTILLTAPKINVFGLRIENSTNATINANTINANNIPYVQNVIILDKSKGVNIAGNKINRCKKARYQPYFIISKHICKYHFRQ